MSQSEESTVTKIITLERPIISIDKFTKDVTTDTLEWTVTGIGTFDIIMDTLTKHIVAQYEANRIRKEDYATAYIQLLQAALNTALQFSTLLLEEEKLAVQLAIAEAQLELLKAQTEAEDAKKELYRRQIKGFDEDFKQKLLKIMVDAWTVGFSVGKDTFQASGIPGVMQKGTIDDLFNNLIYPELEKFEWKEGRHPDFDNKDKLTKPKVKVVDTEKATT